MIKILIGTTQLYELDLLADEVIEFENSIQDIEDLNSVNGSFSKSFTVPATHSNNKLIRYYYETTNSGTFNPKIKTNCEIYDDTIRLIVGYIKLENIIFQNDIVYSYEMTIYAHNSNLFSLIGEAKLEDLTNINVTHIHNFDNISNTWLNYNSQHYVYPIIDYGFNYTVTRNDVQWPQFLVPTSTYTGTTYLSTRLDEFLPAIKVKSYIDAIFDSVGKTYTSDLFLDADFNKLIIPFCNEIPEQDVFILSVYKDFENTYSPAGYGWILDFNQLSSGNYGNWFNFSDDSNVASHLVSYKYKPHTSPAQSNADIYIYNLNQISYFRPQISGKYNINVKQKVKKQISGFDSKIYITLVKQTLYDINSNAGEEIYTKEFIISSNYTTELYMTDISVDLETTDFLYVAIRSDDTFDISYIKCFGNNSFIIDYIDSKIIPYSTTWTYNDIVPKDILQVDFLKSIIKMFNLKVTQDIFNTNNYIIETRDEFYSNGDYFDITNKIDRTTFQYLPNPYLEYNSINLTYEEADDYYNALYKKDFGDDKYIFGHKQIDTGWEWDISENTIDLIFKPTAVASPSSFRNGTNYTDAINFNMSRIWNDDGADLKIQYNQGLRILLFGLRNCDGPDTSNKRMFRVYDDVNNYELLLHNGYSRYVYPYAGHIEWPQGQDNLIGENLDINFETSYYFLNANYSMTGITNLYKEFWFNTIQDLINQDTKMLSVKCKLTTQELQNIDFRDIFFIDNQQYILNKINYSIGNNDLCELELITFGMNRDYKGYNPGFDGKNIIVANTISLGNSTLYGGNSIITGDENSGNGSNGVVAGSGNNINGDVFIITGNGNSTNGNNISIFGNNNSANGDNINIFGDNIIVTTSSTTYIATDNIIFNQQPIINPDILEGGMNEVENVYERVNIINITSGAFNTIKEYGSDDITDIMDGNV